MTNHSHSADHNICGSTSFTLSARQEMKMSSRSRSEGGYTLVALLALMSIVALFAMALAPSIHQQAQREKEKEAIFRGDQIADAIRDYYRYRRAMTGTVGDQALPSSMDQLLEGVPVPGGAKRRQILRLSAARDPLTLEGEWRFIRPRSEPLIDFQQSLMFYANNVLPQPRDQQMMQLQQFAVPVLTSILNTGTASRPTSTTSAGEDSSGPFVGVASRSKDSSVLTFYGIDQHNQWIFTPLFRY